jgi:hypothetical protein
MKNLNRRRVDTKNPIEKLGNYEGPDYNRDYRPTRQIFLMEPNSNNKSDRKHDEAFAH